MKAKIFWLLITALILLSTILVSCASTTSSTASSPPQTSSSSPPSASSSSASVNTSTPPSTTSSAQANWWDKFGTPKYGGSVTLQVTGVIPQFDPYTFIGIDTYVYDPLLFPSWTMDRSLWPPDALFVPEKYLSGYIAKSWAFTDPETITVDLRQNVKWQNKAPVNGREFTSADVAFHYDRMLGTGYGYTSPDPYTGGMLSSLKNVTATDKYTVQFHLNGPCTALAFLTISDPSCINWFEAPEWVALGGPPPSTQAASSAGPPPGGGPPQVSLKAGPLTDWHNVVGTGPWMLTDFVSNASQTYTKNPDYWNTDPRYPQNKTPYIDTLKVLAMTDTATEEAALRTGKLDMLTSITWENAQALNGSNLQSAESTLVGGSGVTWRNDKPPFNDARVRQALNMAIDRQTIDKTYYHGLVDGNPLGAITPSYTGYAYAYNDWPQSLKDKYTYDPTKAKALLAEAGYPNGFNTDCVSDGTEDNLLQIFQQYFKAIGVNMEIKDMDPMTFQNFTTAGKHDAMVSSGGGATFPINRTIDMFYSKGQGSGQNGLKFAPDTVIDDLDTKLQTASADEVASISLSLDKEVIEQQYLCIVGSPGPYNFWSPYLKGYSNEAIGLWQTQTIFARLWIDKGQ